MDKDIARADFESAVRRMSDRAYAKYKTHSYEAGYFHALAVELFDRYVPEQDRKMYIDQIDSACVPVCPVAAL